MPYTSSQSAYPEAVRCSLFGGRPRLHLSSIFHDQH